MEEKCEKVVPESVLLGIANFIDLVPCKQKKKKEEPVVEAPLPDLSFIIHPSVAQ